jgi:hypothetical protein
MAKYRNGAGLRGLKMNRTVDMGNNEQLSRGVFQNADGTFTAMTFTQSKEFKTKKGAEKWLAARS